MKEMEQLDGTKLGDLQHADKTALHAHNVQSLASAKLINNEGEVACASYIPNSVTDAVKIDCSGSIPLNESVGEIMEELLTLVSKGIHKTSGLSAVLSSSNEIVVKSKNMEIGVESSMWLQSNSELKIRSADNDQDNSMLIEHDVTSLTSLTAKVLSSSSANDQTVDKALTLSSLNVCLGTPTITGEIPCKLLSVTDNEYVAVKHVMPRVRIEQTGADFMTDMSVKKTVGQELSPSTVMSDRLFISSNSGADRQCFARMKTHLYEEFDFIDLNDSGTQDDFKLSQKDGFEEVLLNEPLHETSSQSFLPFRKVTGEIIRGDPGQNKTCHEELKNIITGIKIREERIDVSISSVSEKQLVHSDDAMMIHRSELHTVTCNEATSGEALDLAVVSETLESMMLKNVMAGNCEVSDINSYNVYGASTDCTAQDRNGLHSVAENLQDMDVTQNEENCETSKLFVQDGLTGAFGSANLTSIHEATSPLYGVNHTQKSSVILTKEDLFSQEVTQSMKKPSLLCIDGIGNSAENLACGEQDVGSLSNQVALDLQNKALLVETHSRSSPLDSCNTIAGCQVDDQVTSFRTRVEVDGTYQTTYSRLCCGSPMKAKDMTAEQHTRFAQREDITFEGHTSCPGQELAFKIEVQTVHPRCEQEMTVEALEDCARQDTIEVQINYRQKEDDITVDVHTDCVRQKAVADEDCCVCPLQEDVAVEVQTDCLIQDSQERDVTVEVHTDCLIQDSQERDVTVEVHADCLRQDSQEGDVTVEVNTDCPLQDSQEGDVVVEVNTDCLRQDSQERDVTVEVHTYCLIQDSQERDVTVEIHADCLRQDSQEAHVTVEVHADCLRQDSQEGDVTVEIHTDCLRQDSQERDVTVEVNTDCLRQDSQERDVTVEIHADCLRQDSQEGHVTVEVHADYLKQDSQERDVTVEIHTDCLRQDSQEGDVTVEVNTDCLIQDSQERDVTVEIHADCLRQDSQEGDVTVEVHADCLRQDFQEGDVTVEVHADCLRQDSQEGDVVVEIHIDCLRQDSQEGDVTVEVNTDCLIQDSQEGDVVVEVNTDCLRQDSQERDVTVEVQTICPGRGDDLTMEVHNECLNQEDAPVEFNTNCSRDKFYVTVDVQSVCLGKAVNVTLKDQSECPRQEVDFVEDHFIYTVRGDDKVYSDLFTQEAGGNVKVRTMSPGHQEDSTVKANTDCPRQVNNSVFPLQNDVAGKGQTACPGQDRYDSFNGYTVCTAQDDVTVESQTEYNGYKKDIAEEVLTDCPVQEDTATSQHDSIGGYAVRPPRESITQEVQTDCTGREVNATLQIHSDWPSQVTTTVEGHPACTLHEDINEQVHTECFRPKEVTAADDTGCSRREATVEYYFVCAKNSKVVTVQPEDVALEARTHSRRPEDVTCETHTECPRQEDVAFEAITDCPRQEDVAFEARTDCLRQEDVTLEAHTECPRQEDVAFEAHTDCPRKEDFSSKARSHCPREDNVTFETHTGCPRPEDVTWEARTECPRQEDIALEAITECPRKEDVALEARTDCPRQEDIPLEAITDCPIKEDVALEARTDCPRQEDIPLEARTDCPIQDNVAPALPNCLQQEESAEVQCHASCQSLRNPDPAMHFNSINLQQHWPIEGRIICPQHKGLIFEGHTVSPKHRYLQNEGCSVHLQGQGMTVESLSEYPLPPQVQAMAIADLTLCPQQEYCMPLERHTIPSHQPDLGEVRSQTFTECVQQAGVNIISEKSNCCAKSIVDYERTTGMNNNDKLKICLSETSADHVVPYCVNQRDVVDKNPVVQQIHEQITTSPNFGVFRQCVAVKRKRSTCESSVGADAMGDDSDLVLSRSLRVHSHGELSSGVEGKPTSTSSEQMLDDCVQNIDQEQDHCLYEDQGCEKRICLDEVVKTTISDSTRRLSTSHLNEGVPCVHRHRDVSISESINQSINVTCPMVSTSSVYKWRCATSSPDEERSAVCEDESIDRRPVADTIRPLRTCQRPMRLGLSRSQRAVASLHPYLKKSSPP